MSLAIDLLNYRATYNLTQQEVADKIGVSRDIIIKVESEKAIRPVNKQKVLIFINNIRRCDFD